MQYQGGKSMLAKRFAPILDASLLRTGGIYVEPFLGGNNILRRLHNADYANLYDLDKDVVKLWHLAYEGHEFPRSVSFEEYQVMKDKPEHSDHGFMAFCCAYGGKKWSGFARGAERNGKVKNYADMGASSIEKKVKDTQCEDVHIAHSCYSDIGIPSHCTIYCDPPYEGTTGYKAGKFDSSAFLNWCEATARRGIEIFVSEFSNPRGYEVVWEHERKMHIGSSKKKRTELLLRVR